MTKELELAIVMGKVADFAVNVASINKVTHPELAALLREIAKELD